MPADAEKRSNAPKQPPRRNAYSEGENESPKLIETEPTDVEREAPETENEPVERDEPRETDPPIFEE